MGRLEFDSGQTGALASLARLAVDTGGRFTERTNDLSLGYARAQRDRACVYSVGFYDDAEDNLPRGVAVHMRDPGLRAIHPSRFVFRSREEKRTSLLRAAWVAPELFQSGVVRAHAFPLRPSDPSTWDGLLAVSFPVSLENSGGESVTRDFGAVLHKPTGVSTRRVVDRFTRRITLQPDTVDTSSAPVITFLHRVRLEPGRYELTVVLTEPGSAEPHAAQVEIEVPRIPQNELFLVGPILGRPSGPNLVVLGTGEATGGESDQLGETNSFEPLLVQQIEDPTDLVAMTQACMVGSKKIKAKKNSSLRVFRSVTRTDGSSIGALEPEPLVLEGDEKIKCQSLVDVLPVASIRGGDFLFAAEVRGASRSDAHPVEIRFSVGRPGRPSGAETGSAPDPGGGAAP